ncbi:MAG: hypothetical protein ACE5LA_02800 [Dehalococcoidales bacterium]
MSKRKKQRQKGKLPVVTVAYYGPDDKTATKVAVVPYAVHIPGQLIERKIFLFMLP